MKNHIFIIMYISVWVVLTFFLLAVLLFQAVTDRIRIEMAINESCGRPQTINEKAIQDFLSNYTLNNSLAEGE